MGKMADGTEEKDEGIALETPADVARAMARDIRRMRSKKLDTKLGGALMFAYTQLGSLLVKEREHSLDSIPDSVLEAEVERRTQQRAPAGAEAASLQ